MTKHILLLGLAAAVSAVAGAEPRRLEWTTSSSEAREGLLDLQQRIEAFRVGPEAIEAARRVVAADPAFAMGVYYLSAVTPPPENETHLRRARDLAEKASDGERRFIEAMVVARANQATSRQDAIPALEKLAADYPGERLVQVILGQVYQAASQPGKARAAFRRADEIGPASRWTPRWRRSGPTWPSTGTAAPPRASRRSSSGTRSPGSTSRTAASTRR
jgi:hypothetical protein